MLNINNTDISRLFFDGVEIENAYLNGGIIYSKVGAFVATYQIDDFNEALTLPVSKDYRIDWGDGVETTVGNSHFYTSNGIKTVKMYGVVDDFRFDNSGDKLKLLTVENWGGFAPSSLGSIFTGCSNLQRVNDNTTPIIFDSDNSFIRMFCFCFSLEYVNTSNFVFTRETQTAQQAFTETSVLNYPLILTKEFSDHEKFLENATLFNQDVSSLNFSKTKTVRRFMFGKTSANYDYQHYDNLLIKWASGAANGGLDFGKLTNFTTDFGTIQYSSAGAAAHASLVAQGLIINDGGQNAF